MNDFSNKNFDAIVVGTGPGGATVARELAVKNKKVLILEWGGKPEIKGSILQTAGMAGIPGKGILLTNKMVAIVRGITTGGSSIFYYATAFDPPLEMFRQYGIDISKEVEEIRSELPTAPLSGHLMGPMAKRIMESARSLGYQWSPLPKFIYQDKCRAGCGRCNLGCPYGAKWNARMFAEEAVDKGSVLINGARVSRVLTENRKAAGVVFTFRGREHRVYAPVTVIAAGGMGSPVILRASGIKGAGYDYFFDPLICVMGTVKDIKGGHEIPMAAGQRFEEDGYVMTDMTVPRALYTAFTGQVLRYDRLFSHSRTLQIMVKEKDSLGGSITDRGGVRKKLTEADIKKLMHGYERAKKILKNAGARHIFKSWYVAAHPGGTVKVNHLLDSNLQTEYENLYVCDCSVIPEAWGLPPTFTLLALGKRLAKRLTQGETKK
ncbi:MAG: GMC family oxidoreductase N-terminal domain-containing protein [Bacillota bacterium]